MKYKKIMIALAAAAALSAAGMLEVPQKTQWK